MLTKSKTITRIDRQLFHGSLLKPDIMTIVAKLRTHVSKYNWELWSCKCGGYQIIRQIKYCYISVTRNYSITNKIITDHPRKELGIAVNISAQQDIC